MTSVIIKFPEHLKSGNAIAHAYETIFFAYKAFRVCGQIRLPFSD